MCNFLHSGYEKIPKTGIGWKIVGKTTINCDNSPPIIKYIPWLNEYEKEWEVEKWNIWDKTILGDGFCFFHSLKEFQKILRFINPTSIALVKIKYKKGLGKFQSHEVLSIPLIFSICKEFKIIGEEKT